jgi:hypothetical protein
VSLLLVLLCLALPAFNAPENIGRMKPVNRKTPSAADAVWMSLAHSKNQTPDIIQSPIHAI